MTKSPCTQIATRLIHYSFAVGFSNIEDIANKPLTTVQHPRGEHILLKTSLKCAGRCKTSSDGSRSNTSGTHAAAFQPHAAALHISGYGGEAGLKARLFFLKMFFFFAQVLSRQLCCR